MLTQLVDMFAGVIKQTIRGGRTPAARRDVVFAERLDKVRLLLTSPLCRALVYRPASSWTCYMTRYQTLSINSSRLMASCRKWVLRKALSAFTLAT